MAVSGLKKPATNVPEKDEKLAQQYISKGGSAPEAATHLENAIDDDHRLTLRIPKWLLDKIDIKRKERVGTISRNLWILEQLDLAAKD